VSHFVHCLREGLELTDAEFSRKVVAILEAGSQSLREQGPIVELQWLESSRA
jgi:hypothetical protein